METAFAAASFRPAYAGRTALGRWSIGLEDSSPVRGLSLLANRHTAAAAPSLRRRLARAGFVLAAVYSVPALLFGFYSNRPMAFAERFKLSAAALLPAALLFDAAIFLYALGQLTLVGLGVAGVLHIALGWAYLIIAILQLPTVEIAKGNPFSKTLRSGGRH